MTVEKSGGRAKRIKMVTVVCSICGIGMEHYNYEALAKTFFLQGANSMPGILISTGMPPPFLDDPEEAIREAKRGMGEGKK